jgi:hypothetical protein
MSIGSISDALTRVTAIEQQLQSLSSGSLLDSELGVSSDSSSDSSTGATQTADTGSTDFANALAQAQSPDSASATDPTTAAEASTVPSDTGASFGSLADSALATASPTASTLNPTASSLSLLTGGVAPTAPTALTAGATASSSTALTPSQQQFASTLSADTGLNPSVVTSWLLSEESGSAAQTREAAGNNDWLNIGYTDSATFGAQDPIWSDPVTAANATAQWLQGQNSVAGYGTASAGVQAILSSVGQTPAAQIQAIQDSGWASGGYPSLGAMYSQVAGV